MTDIAQIRADAKRQLRRIKWEWKTASCECHWHEPFGEVIMAGCPKHD